MPRAKKRRNSGHYFSKNTVGSPDSTGAPQSPEDEVLVDVAEVGKKYANVYQQNEKTILTVLAGLVLLVVGFFAHKYLVQEPNVKQASSEIYKAEGFFELDSLSKALTSVTGDYKGFEEVITSYGSTPSGNLAKLYAGISYLKSGDFAKAQDALEGFSTSDANFSAIKSNLLGDAVSEQGDFDKALSYYSDAATSIDNNVLTPYYLYKAGLLAEKQGDKSKALSYFSSIKSDYPTSDQARQIDAEIARVK